MGCCAFVNENRQLTNENYEILVPKSESSKSLKSNTQINNNSYLSIIIKEDKLVSNEFPTSLIKSINNPNGIVVIKMKN